MKPMSTPDDHRRSAQREDAALTERHWVRLTSCCNNRCLFCLDAEAQDGTVRPRGDVVADIEEGARRGRRRLVLSGGEPTIHPDFHDLVAAGVASGYERVQVISNGRMFARHGFLDAAVQAGLGELTVSLHGHRAELHDRLVGVPGAFAQTVRALRAALEVPGLVVNVDIVVCGANVASLDAIVALCRSLGVQELDLLQVQPAGRAVRTPGMLYDAEPAREVLSRVFSLSRREDLFIWTNRFPVDLLEGFEELIQDPHKMVDEVRGRREQVLALLERGEPLRCRDERCRACFLRPLCDELHEHARLARDGGFEEVLIDLRGDTYHGGNPFLEKVVSPGPPSRKTFRNSSVTPHVRHFRENRERVHESIARPRLIARSFEDARALAAGSLSGREVAVWLETGRDLPCEPGLAVRIAGLPVTRIGGEAPDVLEAASRLDVAEVEVAPGLENEDWLERLGASLGSRLVVRPAPRGTLSECLARDIPPERLAALLATTGGRVEDMPPCLAGGRPVSWTRIPFQPAPRGTDLDVHLERLVERFAATRYFARSSRCRECVCSDTCRGLHVQRVRAFGLRVLAPVAGG
jgi:pyruvate-formate lyase-activating enzyme